MIIFLNSDPKKPYESGSTTLPLQRCSADVFLKTFLAESPGQTSSAGRSQQWPPEKVLIIEDY